MRIRDELGGIWIPAPTYELGISRRRYLGNGRESYLAQCHGLLQDDDLVALSCQRNGSRQSPEPGTDDSNSQAHFGSHGG